jgi:hypothetical protein
LFIGSKSLWAMLEMVKVMAQSGSPAVSGLADVAQTDRLSSNVLGDGATDKMPLVVDLYLG